MRGLYKSIIASLAIFSISVTASSPMMPVPSSFEEQPTTTIAANLLFDDSLMLPPTVEPTEEPPEEIPMETEEVLESISSWHPVTRMVIGTIGLNQIVCLVEYRLI